MRKKSLKVFKYKKERVVFSDVLPFETPITFTNRHFYHFLTNNGVEITNERLAWNDGNQVLDQVVKLLFDFRNKNPKTISINGEPKKIINLRDNHTFRTAPFNYKISYGQSSFRELAIIHPKNQLDVVQFYDNFKHLIIYYCNVGSFSIRRPVKVASSKFFRDNFYLSTLRSETKYDSIEESDKEYESLKTFFSYKSYSNIHKFYESYKYHRCEKKYDKLYKFDISKCFDSIYSHSIAWAVIGRDIVKDQINASLKTFSGVFDRMMQDLNHAETNGIVIGPEFSRLFAEIILQKIDRKVEDSLKFKHQLLHKVHYEVFRYVDDYFIFYNDEETKNKIQLEFKIQLREFKLNLNDAKTLQYSKPIITEVTIAKQLISSLFIKHLSPIDSQPSEKEHGDTLLGEIIHVSSNHLITSFKTVIKDTGVDYKDIMNFTLALIDRKATDVIKIYTNSKAKIRGRDFTKIILELLDVTFFLYSISPRVNTTIKLTKILHQVIDLCKSDKDFYHDFKDIIFKKMYDNLYFNLQKNKSAEHTQVETLYLLITLRELGKEYLLGQESIREYFCIQRTIDGTLSYHGKLNYFSIIVFLFYIKDKKKYQELKDFVINHILDRFKSVKREHLGKNTELVLLLFDLMTCPFLDLSVKKRILAINGIKDSNEQQAIIKYRKNWFTTWTDFNLGLELNAKHGLEVY